MRLRIACEAVGLDPDLGLLHVDDRLRESFIYDLLEPLRSKADVWALELLHKEKLHPAMFHELRDGIVRLDPDLTELLASSLMPGFLKAALELANEYVQQVRQTPVARKLVREATKTVAVKHGSSERGKCGYCKEPLPRKGLKFCGRQCYLRYSVEIAKPMGRGSKQTRRDAPAAGLSPGHGGQAAKTRRGLNSPESDRKRALYLTPDEWRKRKAEQMRGYRAKNATK